MEETEQQTAKDADFTPKRSARSVILVSMLLAACIGTAVITYRCIKFRDEDVQSQLLRMGGPLLASAQQIPSEQIKLDSTIIDAVQTAFAQKEQTKEARKNGGIVRFKDAEGRTVYVDSIDKVPESFRGSVDQSHVLPKITKMETVLYVEPNEEPANASAQSAKVDARRGVKKLEVLVASWCPYCRQLEALLKKKGISYSRLDIEKNKTGAALYEQLGRGGLPISKFGSEVVRGYDPERIFEMLDRNK